MVEDGAQTVHIAMPPYLAALSTGLLRRHKVRRTEHLSGHRDAGVTIEPLSQAKIRDARLIAGVHQHIRRLEIAVQDALLMRVLNRLSDQLDVTRGFRRR